MIFLCGYKREKCEWIILHFFIGRISSTRLNQELKIESSLYFLLRCFILGPSLFFSLPLKLGAHNSKKNYILIYKCLPSPATAR